MSSKILSVKTKKTNDFSLIESPSLSLLPGSLWPGMVVPVRVTSVGQTDLWKLFVLDRNTWYYTTVHKLFINNYYYQLLKAI